MVSISSEQTRTDSRQIAFFDLDRTITRAVSGRLLVKNAYVRGLMKKRDLIKALWLSSAYRLNLRDPVSIMNDMIKWVEGIELSDFEDLCSGVADKALLPSVYREAAVEIESHKENNVPTVLLSSTVCQICRIIAGYLGMDDFICTRLEVSDSRLTGLSLGSLCYGEEKAKRLSDYCENRKIAPANSWYYGDSISDLPALLLVGNPVCVNPDRKLEKEARSRGWKVCSWQVSVN
jgi:HAD superfamily hydrolase (TIGR01490 family)